MDQANAVAAPVKSNAAKFVFFYLIHLVSLGFMTVSFGMILFQIINKNIADIIIAGTGSFDENALKFGISALLVATPIYYVISSFIQKSLFTGELKKDSAIRRWLTYLILFVSFLIFIGWLIAFVNNFLNGELTMKFIFKTLTVLAIAATVFGYYLYDIRRPAVENSEDKVVKIFFYASLAAAVIVLVAAFFSAGSPVAARDQRLDEQTISQFSQIDSCVNEYYNVNKKLPVGFAEMQGECAYLTPDVWQDSQTKAQFIYTVTGTTTYQICANFRTSNIGKANNPMGVYPVTVGGNDYVHDQGDQCLKHIVFAAIKTQ
ncbi:MAG TPA: DUF5671 domain-containing protein [Candidatus Methylomirabilis sp.]|nr:DUF5671 domain-containing protein [Candidatus Methylomirabilis sp.]